MTREGSGKTMTSFKAAERAAAKLDVDKVVFLMDRIELTNQSAGQYKNFAQYSSEIQETDSAVDLLWKLKNDSITHRLIVTSIQKMSMINEEHGFGKEDLEKIRDKRIVFIIDEVHRSTFGKMLYEIKQSFPYAMFFGFTGTPIQMENMKKGHTTASVIGDELHRYTITDGIRDGNVLGFDVTSVSTYSDFSMREEVAKYKAGSSDIDEIMNDAKKSKIFEDFMNPSKTPMARDSRKSVDGEKRKNSIEENIKNAQYENPLHREKVVEDILRRFPVLSRGGKFHSIFATSSIPEAIEYFKIFEKKKSEGRHNLKVTAIVDPHDNFERIRTREEKDFFKSEELGDMLRVYNENFDKGFSVSDFDRYKKDVTARLSHRHPYIGIERDGFEDERIDIVIVVNQLLTGYDSKWVNTLYLDKVLEYENLIQAFSRTNRLCGSQKPFGNIRYYRKIHTMRQNIKNAVKMYSGENPFGLFADKIFDNVKGINEVFASIEDLFIGSGVSDFSRLPDDDISKAKFGNLFKKLDKYIESAKIQGFDFSKKFYDSEDGTDTVELMLEKEDYEILVQRYNELPQSESSETGEGFSFDVDYEIIEKHQAIIDYEYLNNNFERYLKVIDEESDPEIIENISNELHRSFATLPSIKQKYAEIILGDISSGDFKEIEGYDFIDYINEYQANIETRKIDELGENLGLDTKQLDKLSKKGFSPGDDINVFGGFDKLLDSVDKKKARKYLEEVTGKKLKPFEVNIKLDKLLREFIMTEDMDVEKFIKKEL